MSQENVERSYRVIDAFNRGDVEAALALLDEDVEVVSRLAPMGEGRYRGHDGFLRWRQNLRDVFPDWHAELVEVRDVGDFTMGLVRIRGHGDESGAPVDQVIWQVGEWRDGKLVRFSSHDSEAEALEAAGLSEQDAHPDS
jgi:ketosteroid isomerase-like protein